MWKRLYLGIAVTMLLLNIAIGLAEGKDQTLESLGIDRETFIQRFNAVSSYQLTESDYQKQGVLYIYSVPNHSSVYICVAEDSDGQIGMATALLTETGSDYETFIECGIDAIEVFFDSDFSVPVLEAISDKKNTATAFTSHLISDGYYVAYRGKGNSQRMLGIVKYDN